MANNPHLSAAARNAALDTLNTTIGSGGFLRIYSGTQPANADAALGGNTQLAELALSSSPFAAASSGSVSINTVTNDSSADATGTASFASLVTSGGTRVLDLSVGLSSADVIIDNTSIVAGQVVACTSLTFSLPA